jgi:Ser-tRNA(Ala) deacylase AlaX
MTRKIFWEEPYRTSLETTLVRVAETIAYAFSGGQERDTGTIGGHAINEARTTGVRSSTRWPTRAA